MLASNTTYLDGYDYHSLQRLAESSGQSWAVHDSIFTAFHHGDVRWAARAVNHPNAHDGVLLHGGLEYNDAILAGFNKGFALLHDSSEVVAHYLRHGVTIHADGGQLKHYGIDGAPYNSLVAPTDALVSVTFPTSKQRPFASKGYVLVMRRNSVIAAIREDTYRGMLILPLPVAA